MLKLFLCDGIVEYFNVPLETGILATSIRSDLSCFQTGANALRSDGQFVLSASEKAGPFPKWTEPHMIPSTQKACDLIWKAEVAWDVSGQEISSNTDAITDSREKEERTVVENKEKFNAGCFIGIISSLDFATNYKQLHKLKLF